MLTVKQFFVPFNTLTAADISFAATRAFRQFTRGLSSG